MDKKEKVNFIHTLQGKLINSTRDSVIYSISSDRAFVVRNMKELPIITALAYHDIGDTKYLSGWVNNKSIFIAKHKDSLSFKVGSKVFNKLSKLKYTTIENKVIGVDNIIISIFNSGFASSSKEVYIGYNDCAYIYDYPKDCDFRNLKPTFNKYIQNNSLTLYVKTKSFSELVSYCPKKCRIDRNNGFATLVLSNNANTLDIVAVNLMCSLFPEIREFLI